MCTFLTVIACSIIYALYLMLLRKRLEHLCGKLFMGYWFRFFTHFISILALGITIEGGLHFASHSCQNSLLTILENTAVDRIMNFWVWREPSDAIKPYLKPIVWIDIDEKTYEDLGEPLAIHRDYLWRLIATGIENQARAIIVDFALDRPVEPQGETLADGDKRLKDCLSTYSALARGTQQSDNDACFDKQKLPLRSFPPIIIAKGLRHYKNPIEERQSALIENLVENSNVLFWASPTFTEPTTK